MTQGSRLTLLTTLAVLQLASVSAQAAVKKKAVSASLVKVSMADTKEALELPMIERLSVLRTQGKTGYKNLTTVMFDRKAEMEDRWRAVTAAARIGGRDSLPELSRAVRSEEWFMRNAALVAASNVDRGQALSWARQLMNDKALVVRAAAVEVIKNQRDMSSSTLLWEKLHAKENFRGNQSLFIRRQIVEALASLEGAGKEAKFVALLNDKDEALHAPAISALERMTGNKLGGAEPVKFKKAHWQNWWRNRTSATM